MVPSLQNRRISQSETITINIGDVVNTIFFFSSNNRRLIVGYPRLIVFFVLQLYIKRYIYTYITRDKRKE